MCAAGDAGVERRCGGVGVVQLGMGDELNVPVAEAGEYFVACLSGPLACLSGGAGRWWYFCCSAYGRCYFFSGRLNPDGEDLFEVGDVEGFGDVVVHAGGEATLAVAGDGVGG